MIVTKDFAFENLDDFAEKLFIYPTDSIYGIGCDATDVNLISKLRLIKNRNDKPFSIIAPSKEWVKEHFILDDVELSIVEQFGSWINIDGELKPFTVLLRPKNINLMPENLTFGLPRVGVRIPMHWISDFVSKLGVPIVTTSVNETGTPYMTSMDDLDDDIRNSVDYIVDEGVLSGYASALILVEDNEVKYLRK